MTDKPEALLQRLERLGQDGVGNYGMPICAEAAAELRRLHAVNAELLERADPTQTPCDTAEDGVCEVIDCCRNPAQILEALEIGYDSAQAEAAQYHAAMAGYRPERHAEMDADVQKIAKAISTLKAALAQQEQEPHWLTKELMADYLDMVAEALEENRSEMLRHKAHWMRKRGEV